MNVRENFALFVYVLITRIILMILLEIKTGIVTIVQAIAFALVAKDKILLHN